MRKSGGGGCDAARGGRKRSGAQRAASWPREPCARIEVDDRPSDGYALLHACVEAGRVVTEATCGFARLGVRAWSQLAHAARRVLCEGGVSRERNAPRGSGRTAGPAHSSLSLARLSRCVSAPCARRHSKLPRALPPEHPATLSATRVHARRYVSRPPSFSFLCAPPHQRRTHHVRRRGGQRLAGCVDSCVACPQTLSATLSLALGGWRAKARSVSVLARLPRPQSPISKNRRTHASLPPRFQITAAKRPKPGPAKAEPIDTCERRECGGRRAGVCCARRPRGRRTRAALCSAMARCFARTRPRPAPRTRPAPPAACADRRAHGCRA